MNGHSSRPIDLTRPNLSDLSCDLKAVGRARFRDLVQSEQGDGVTLREAGKSAFLRFMGLPESYRKRVVTFESREKLLEAVLAYGNTIRESGSSTLVYPDWCVNAPLEIAQSHGYEVARMPVYRRRTAPAAFHRTNHKVPKGKSEAFYLESPDFLGHVESESGINILTGSFDREFWPEYWLRERGKVDLVVVDQSGLMIDGTNMADLHDESFFGQIDRPVSILAADGKVRDEPLFSFVDFERFPTTGRRTKGAMLICSKDDVAEKLRATYPREKTSKGIDGASLFALGLASSEIVARLRRVVRANAGSFYDRLPRRYDDWSGFERPNQAMKAVNNAMLTQRLALPVADFMGPNGIDGVTEAEVGTLIQDCFRRSGVVTQLHNGPRESYITFDALQDPDLFAEAVNRLDPVLNAPNGLFRSLEQQPQATLAALESGVFQDRVAGNADPELEDLTVRTSGWRHWKGRHERIAVTDGRAVARGREVLGSLVHERSEAKFLEVGADTLARLLGVESAPRSQSIALGARRSLTSAIMAALDLRTDGRVSDLSEIARELASFERMGYGINERRFFKGDRVDTDKVLKSFTPKMRALILPDPWRLMGPTMSQADLLKVHRACKAAGILLVVDRSLDVGVIGFEDRNRFVIDKMVANGDCAFFSDTGPLVAQPSFDDERVSFCVFPTAEMARSAVATHRGRDRTDSSLTFASLALLEAAVADRDGYFHRLRSEMARHLPLLRRMNRVETPRRLFGLKENVAYGCTPIRPAANGAKGQKRLLVVGGGIAGIAVGLEAIARGIPVTVVDDSPVGADDLVRSGISVIAAAQFVPFINSNDPKVRAEVARRVRMSRITYGVLASNPALTGVLPMTNVELLVDGDRWASELEQAMKTGAIDMDAPISATDLGHPAVFERYYQFDGFSINTPRTLQFLREAFVHAGGVIEHRTITPDEVKNWDGPVVIAAGTGAPDFSDQMEHAQYVGGSSIEFNSHVPLRKGDVLAGISGGHAVMLPRIKPNGEYTWVIGGGSRQDPRHMYPQKDDFDTLVLDARGMGMSDVGAWTDPGEQAFTNPLAYRSGWRTYNPEGVSMVRREGNAVMVSGLEGTGWTLAFGLARDAVDMACGAHRQLTTRLLA